VKPVALVFQYTQNEYVKAERQYLFASKTITKTSVAVLAIYVPVSIITLFLSSFSGLSIIAVAIAMIAAAAGSILYFYIPTYKFKQTEKYHEEYTLTFSDAGVNFKTPTIDSELKWEIYSGMWESDAFFFLIHAPRMYTLIPKRAFENPDAQQNFEEIALANLKGTKRML